MIVYKKHPGAVTVRQIGLARSAMYPASSATIMVTSVAVFATAATPGWDVAKCVPTTVCVRMTLAYATLIRDIVVMDVKPQDAPVCL